MQSQFLRNQTKNQVDIQNEWVGFDLVLDCNPNVLDNEWVGFDMVLNYHEQEDSKIPSKPLFTKGERVTD